MAQKKKGKSKARKGKRVGVVSRNTTERTVCVRQSAGTDGEYLVVNLPKMLSASNMRQYDQCMTYRFRLDVINKETADCTYTIYTLPENWYTIGAIRYAAKMYRTAMKDELEVSGGKKARWHDFRPTGITSLENAWIEAEPVYSNGDAWKLYATDQWETSDVTDSDGNTKSFTLWGTSNAYNIFQEYRDYILGLRTEPSAHETDLPYEGLQPDVKDMDELMQDYSLPPYSANFQDGGNDDGGSTTPAALEGQLLKRQILLSDSAASVTTPLQSDWINAPLGLVYVKNGANFSTSTPHLAIECAAGAYKGVNALRIANG